MPPSKFEGREPATETRYFYDRRGRLTRSVTTREPQWTDQDRTELLALAEYRDTLCPNGCGQPISESTSNADTGPQYNISRTTCRACAAVLEEKRAAADGGAGDNQARIWRISKTDGGS